MAFWEILLISIGLAADATAVSAASATCSKNGFRDIVKMAFSFGLFQALMPIIGFWLGTRLAGIISGVDHWIAFGLLTFIAAKIFKEAKDGQSKSPASNSSILILSLATSIDALVVGITFAFLEINIVVPVIAVGLVTFCMSLVGGLVGRQGSQLLGKRVGYVGSLVLFGVGSKILIEHLGIL